MKKALIDANLLDDLIHMMKLTQINKDEKSQLLNELINTLDFIENLNNFSLNNKINVNLQTNVWFEDGSINERNLHLNESILINQRNLFIVDKVL